MEKMLKLIRSKLIKNIIYYLGNYILRIFYCIISLWPVKGNRVLFSNYNGKGYGDNPKYVADALRKISPDTETIWIVSSNATKVPSDIKTAKLYSIMGFVSFATSKVWISNARLPLFLIKKKSQRYYQLWHGGIGPKKVEGAAEDKLIKWYLSCAKHDSKMADYFVSNSDFNTNMIRKYFWYKGEILEYGSPRHDVFFYEDNSISEKVKTRLNIEKNSKIVLYAPTFRDDKRVDIYKWDYDSVIQSIGEKVPGDWKFVLRLHPNISFEAGEFNYSENVVNGTDYDDMQELIVASDVIITDYSGVMTQAAIARKALFLLLPDKNKYLMDRGLCFDINELPFDSAERYDELCYIIKTFDKVAYMKKLNHFLDNLGLYDCGDASEKVARSIVKYLQE